MSWLHEFKGGGGGFGLTSYNRARAAGHNPIAIADEIGRSGLGLGWRARDAIIRDSASQAYQLKEQRNSARDTSSAYQSQVEGLQNQINSFNQRISDYDSQISGYQTKVQDLTGQYNTALQTAEQNAKDRDEYQRQFRDASDRYAQEKLTADRYREEAVSNQLRAVRSGATAGAGTQDQQMRGSLASGKTGYSSDDKDISDLADSMKSQGGLTDSVLSREGPVVQQLSGGGGSGGRTSGGNQRNAQNSAGTGSYYASRFR